MNRDKQIEEMYKDVYEAINHNAVIDITHGGYIGVNTERLTKELYDDGYRKASDLARDITDEILRYIDTHKDFIAPIPIQTLIKFGEFLGELEKKCTESEKEK